jgi:hypothetical protein
VALKDLIWSRAPFLCLGSYFGIPISFEGIWSSERLRLYMGLTCPPIHGYNYKALKVWTYTMVVALWHTKG